MNIKDLTKDEIDGLTEEEKAVMKVLDEAKGTNIRDFMGKTGLSGEAVGRAIDGLIKKCILTAEVIDDGD